MDELRLGIVGSGGMANRRAESFDAQEGCGIVAVAARNPETGPPLAERHGADLLTDWQALVDREDVDALVICTHNEIHGAIAISALEAGKHVFAEYPVVRFREEAGKLDILVGAGDAVLHVAHRENVSAGHGALKREVNNLGRLMAALFVRLTPGRGGRPEVLFNLDLSGPPALFFVYHVYPIVDLFGPAAWVEGGAEYVDLGEDRGYRRFVNTVTVGFEKGGLGQWNWAGGIEIADAEEHQRIVLTGGTLVREGGKWSRSTPAGVEELPPTPDEGQTLEARFVEYASGRGPDWRPAASRAIHAARIGIAAEISASEGRRVPLSEIA